MERFSGLMQPHLPDSDDQPDLPLADTAPRAPIGDATDAVLPASIPPDAPDGILAQATDAPKPAPPPGRTVRRYLPTTARIGVLGVVAVILWWTWSRTDIPNFAPEPEQSAAAPADRALAVVNPVNVTAEAEAEADAEADAQDVPAHAVLAMPAATSPTPANWADTIVVVTPTILPAQGQAATQVNNAAAVNAEPAAAEPENAPAEPAGVPALAEGSSVDDRALNAMLAPLLETQVAATPMVIELEIPAAGSNAERKSLPSLAMLPAAGSSNGLMPEIVLLPTATATPDPVRLAALPATLPKVQIIPAVGVKITPTPTALPPTPAPTAVPNPTYPGFGPGRLWSTFAPLPPEQADHFWLGDPFADTAPNSMASPNYQFGSTAGNRYRPHHGLDTSNPLGTPIQAAVEGEVVHAGPDDPQLLGPYNNFYGNAVVIKLDRKLPVAGGQVDVFVLYGHMHEVYAKVGQHVSPSDVIGVVGMTGIAIGPHLHTEVRLGANTYTHNVNPYLWIKPRDGDGAVAVRILTADNRTWAGAKVSIALFEGGRAVWARQIETYLDTENIGPDPAWGDNGAMGDVPAGEYYLIGNVDGESIRAEFTVNPGQTTFVEIRTKH